MPTPHETRLTNFAHAHGLTLAELRADPDMMKAARGHAQAPEHGRGALRSLPRVQHYPGREIRSTYTDRQAERIINRAADDGARVTIKVHVKGEGWRQLGGARGFSAGMVADRQATAGSIREAVGGGYLPGASGHGDSDTLEMEEADDIDAWQIDTLE